VFIGAPTVTYGGGISFQVTTPSPFKSMEMDTLLRQHNADERERAKVS